MTDTAAAAADGTQTPDAAAAAAPADPEAEAAETAADVYDESVFPTE